jgi:DNA-binding MurR/RpiR family transcriptional regulator
MTNPFAQLETSLEEIRLKLDYLASEPKQAEFLTVQQACQLLNISKSTIYKRTMNSEIPFYKLNIPVKVRQ